jgi:hypothetical protein
MAILSSAMLLGGCQPATIYYTALLSPPHAMAPHRAEDVEVFVVTPPAAPHVNVGLLEITTGDDLRTAKQMVARLRAEAAALGCDALLIMSIQNQAPGRYGRPSMHASCVVYKTVPPPAVGRS